MPSSVTNETVVRHFVRRVNAQDTEGIVAACAPDHRFIDSLGNVLAGREALERAWAGFFSMFPDYHVEIGGIASDGDLVLLEGWASATHAASGAEWRIPAAWRALVRDGRIAEWQVYADNEPVREILGGGD